SRVVEDAMLVSGNPVKITWDLSTAVDLAWSFVVTLECVSWKLMVKQLVVLQRLPRFLTTCFHYVSYRYMIYIYGTNTFNSKPEDIKKSPNCKVSKARLRRHMIGTVLKRLPVPNVIRKICQEPFR
ncbi:hypothetical protein J6590_076084, partial [Homalodisca vitripennis]